MNPDALFDLAKAMLQDRYDKAAHRRFERQSAPGN
jgi:hypothetical protein